MNIADFLLTGFSSAEVFFLDIVFLSHNSFEDKAKVIFCKNLNVKYFKYDLRLFRIFLSFLELFWEMAVNRGHTNLALFWVRSRSLQPRSEVTDKEQCGL